FLPDGSLPPIRPQMDRRPRRPHPADDLSERLGAAGDGPQLLSCSTSSYLRITTSWLGCPGHPNFCRDTVFKAHSSLEIRLLRSRDVGLLVVMILSCISAQRAIDLGGAFSRTRWRARC